MLIKDRWFTAVAVIALALGIGVNATVFTFVNAVLIRGLPIDDPDKVHVVGTKDSRGRDRGVQTGTRDPVTMTTIIALLTVVSLAACFWPARRGSIR